MKILSLILSTTMLINSIPCGSLYAKQEAPQDLCTPSPGKSCISGTPTGTDSFKSFMQEKEQHGWTFVDKSLLIKEIIDSSDRATLITRPRRWGKSLNLSMLECFFRPEVDEITGQKATRRVNNLLFSNLLIDNHFTDTREILNRLLLSYVNDEADFDNMFFRNRGMAAEMASAAGASIELTSELLKKTVTLPEEEIRQLKNAVKNYGRALLNQLSRFDNLPSLLNELNQLYSQMQGAAEHEKQEAESQYNTKFETVRQQIETYVENNTDLKAELSKEFDLMSRHQGQYPTILLSLKGVKKDTYNEAREEIASEMVRLFSQYKYLKPIAQLWEESDENDIKFWGAIRKNIIENKEISVEKSLSTLSQWLYQYHGKKAYVLIDEYDAGPNYLLFKDRTTKEDILPVAKLISDILSPLCKGNEFVEKVVLTGVFDTLYREAGSGINNVRPYSILSPKYSDYYGFSEAEIRQRFLSRLPKEIQGTLIGQLEAWYDGYTDKHLYTPWPVVLHLSKVIESCKTQCDYTLKPENYWNQSGVSDALDKIANIFKKLNQVSQTDIDINKFLFINHPYTETRPSSISMIFDGNKNKADIFRYMLVHFGYLTTKNQVISTPNEEVRALYREHFENWVAVSKPDDLLPFISSIIQFYVNQLSPDILSHRAPEIKMLVDVLNEKKPVGYEGVIQQLNTLSERLSPQSVISSLLKGDYENLKKLVKENTPCSIPFSQFNVFHLAAMVGDSTTWELLKERCSDVETLLKQPDKVLRILPGGYIFLSDHADLNQDANATHLMCQPSYTESIYCCSIPALTGGAVGKIFTTLLQWGYYDRLRRPVPGQPHGLLNRLYIGWNVFTTSGTFLGLAVGGYSSKVNNWFDSHCYNYNNYTSINATTPSLFTSLPQFEKYIVDKQDAYVRIGDTCSHNDKKLIQITQPLIQSGGQYKEMPLSLCQDEEGQGRILPLPTGNLDINVVGTSLMTAVTGFLVYFGCIVWKYRNHRGRI